MNKTDYILIGLMVVLIIIQTIRLVIPPFSFDYLTIGILAGTIIIIELDRQTRQTIMKKITIINKFLKTYFLAIFIVLICTAILGYVYKFDKFNKDEIGNYIGKLDHYEGEYAILDTGEKLCSLDVSTVFFENKNGYVFREWEKDMGGGKRLNETWNEGGGISFYPEEEIVICKNRESYSGRCINETANYKLLCSACITINNNGTMEDNKRECLSYEEQQYLALTWR